MDLRRVRYGEWIAGISGFVLLIALFLSWYSNSAGDNVNAWDAFAVTDVLLAVVGLGGVALMAGAATQRSPAVPQSTGALVVPFALVGAVLVIVKVLSLPDGASGREIGLWIGLVSTLGVLVGCWRSIGDESFPREATPQVEVTPLPAPKPRSEPATDE